MPGKCSRSRSSDHPGTCNGSAKRESTLLFDEDCPQEVDKSVICPAEPSDTGKGKTRHKCNEERYPVQRFHRLLNNLGTVSIRA